MPRGTPVGDHPSRAAVADDLVRYTPELGRAALERSREERAPLLDLAPGGVCRAVPVARNAGGLLHHRFTLTASPWRRGGLFSVALSRGSPRVGVAHHLALWSPDLPRGPGHPVLAAARPAHPRPGAGRRGRGELPPGISPNRRFPRRAPRGKRRSVVGSGLVDDCSRRRTT